MGDYKVFNLCWLNHFLYDVKNRSFQFVVEGVELFRGEALGAGLAEKAVQGGAHIVNRLYHGVVIRRGTVLCVDVFGGQSLGGFLG